MSKLILSIVGLFARRAWIFYAIAFLTMAAGLITDRLVGGESAWLAGRIQAIGLVTFMFFGSVYLLFRKYLGATRVPGALIAIFLLLAIVSIYFTAFSAFSIVKHVS